MTIACCFSLLAISIKNEQDVLFFAREFFGVRIIRLCMPGTSISVELKRVRPPLVDISPRTAIRFNVHCVPLLVSVHGDVRM